MRSLRLAPEQAVFNARTIPVCSSEFLNANPWFRLCQKAYANQFFPSLGSRLTPSSRAFPCVYLGLTTMTAVAEVYGDRFAASQQLGYTLFTIEKTLAASYLFLRVDVLPSLRICDLTKPDVRLAVGIDSATLYATDLSIPQAWAERIARHPADFDGIYYRSRHADEPCVALWQRLGVRRDLGKELTFKTEGEFLESTPAYLVAQRMGLRLSFV